MRLYFERHAYFVVDAAGGGSEKLLKEVEIEG